MVKPKFGKWTCVEAVLPGRDESVITLDATGEVGVSVGRQVANDDDVLFWMPLPPTPTDPAIVAQFMLKKNED